VANACGPVLSDSRVFGTGRITSSTLEDGSLPLTVSAIARPTLAAQALMAGGATGRVLGNAAAAGSSSAFARGGWPRLVGAGLLGLGCGRLSQGIALPIVLMLVGLLLVFAGPALLSALRDGSLARFAARYGRAGGAPPARAARGRLGAGLGEVSRITWVTMLLCAAAGVMAGAAPGNGAKEVVAIVLAFAVAALVLWRPEVVLLVVAAFPWIDWAARGSLGGLGPLWDDALLVLSVGLLLWSALVLGRVTPRTVPVALPVLLMVAAALGSIVVRKVPGSVGLYALRVLFEPILFYFVGFLFPKNMRWVRWTVAVFLATCTLLAVHGLYQYVIHAPMPANWVDVTETNIVTRAYSVVQNPNVLGGLLAMGALISGSLALSRAFQGARRFLLAVACLVQLAGLAVTFSRGAWVGFAVGVLGAIILGYRRYLMAVIGVAIVAWLAAPRVFMERLLFSFTNAYAQRSSAGLGRLYRWDASLYHVVEHPLLGVGLGTFGGTTAYMFGYWALWVDNFYLQMAAEGGLLLLVFFLWLLLRGAKGLVRGHRVASDPYLKALAAGMFGAFLAIIVADAFEADWETLAVAVEFWFLAGLVTSAALQSSRSEEAAAGQEVSASGATESAGDASLPLDRTAT
jgi:O-antigen ligase